MEPCHVVDLTLVEMGAAEIDPVKGNAAVHFTRAAAAKIVFEEAPCVLLSLQQTDADLSGGYSLSFDVEPDNNQFVVRFELPKGKPPFKKATVGFIAVGRHA
jgi:hypothetical protein